MNFNSPFLQEKTLEFDMKKKEKMMHNKGDLLGESVKFWAENDDSVEFKGNKFIF